MTIAEVVLVVVAIGLVAVGALAVCAVIVGSREGRILDERARIAHEALKSQAAPADDV